MNKRIFLVTIFLTISYFGLAETRPSTQDSIKKYKKFYIVELDDSYPIATRYLFLDPKTIADLSSISDISNAELSKLLNVDFVVVIKFDPGTKLLTLNKVLKFYKINTLYWSLPVMVDDEKIADPQTVLIARNQIKKVSVVKNTGGAYIQITLIK